MEVITPSNRYGTGVFFLNKGFQDNINEATTLADLAGKDSWFTIHILQLDCGFLPDNVETWPQSAAFQSPMVNVRAINVVNDAAERAVKVSFLLAAWSEDHYHRNILRVVEQNRRKIKSAKAQTATVCNRTDNLFWDNCYHRTVYFR